MWHVRLTRKEVLDVLISGGRNSSLQIQETNTVFTNDREEKFHVYWNSRPTVGESLPSLVVTPDDDVSLFTAINASPQAPTPISALCRFLTRSEAEAYFEPKTLFSRAHGDQNISYAYAALAIAEAIILSEGRVNLGQITPALCKRTLSYAWARGLVAGIPPQSMELLPARWVATYRAINAHSSFELINTVVGATVSILSEITQLNIGLKPKSPAGEMAFAILRGDSHAKESVWHEFGRVLPTGSVELRFMASASREERGVYLQRALRAASADRSKDAKDDVAAAACAFVATQVAPASLEHLEVLREAGNPSIIYLYVLFATLQYPSAILSGIGGLGQRVLRDISANEEPLARPTADISYTELKAIERLGVEGFAKKLGHVGEVEVELVPMVKSSFKFSARRYDSRGEDGYRQMSLDQAVASSGALQPKEKLRLLLESLTEVISQLPDDSSESGHSGKKSRRR